MDAQESVRAKAALRLVKCIDVLEAHDFLAAFEPLETIIDGLPIPRGGLISVTGATGSGKTTICAALQVALRMGRRFADREVTQGSVLVLAGENPDDYAMHLAATLQYEGIDSSNLGGANSNKMFVVPGVFDLLHQWDQLDQFIADSRGNLVAVFVDTSAAFYQGDDENDNVAMRRHASVLRALTKLPGKPTVFVLCHPTKSATKENLLPRGGGSFLAEVDANLTVWKDESGAHTMHYAGKIRGAGFDPIRFELIPVELNGKTDCRGRVISSVAARFAGGTHAKPAEVADTEDEVRLLKAMHKQSGASIRKLAKLCGMTNDDDVPLVSRVSRRLQRLGMDGLAIQTRSGTWQLTATGEEVAKGTTKAGSK